jgi:hypothetical protein
MNGNGKHRYTTVLKVHMPHYLVFEVQCKYRHTSYTLSMFVDRKYNVNTGILHTHGPCLLTGTHK